jgi:hypothetical protein
MTKDELWEMYESIRANRERIKAERRARDATGTGGSARPPTSSQGPVEA